MKNLIDSKNNSIAPDGAVGKQKFGIIFWQKTGFLRHCSELGFRSTITLIEKKYHPASVQTNGKACLIQLDPDEKKWIFLSLEKERNSNHHFLYGESHTIFAGAEFHLFALEIVGYIAKNLGCKFYVDDATGYLEHGSKEKLEQYIENCDTPFVDFEKGRLSVDA